MKYSEKSLRHELKYFINMHEYMYLKERLSGILKKDKHGLVNDEYHIRSLYFDDVYNSAFTEKELGVFKRKKYRIRIYNMTDKLIKLEKKSKYGQYISKEMISLTRKGFYKLLREENEFLIQSNNKFLQELYIEIKTKLLKPVVIVDYEREAYILEAGNVRITFDKNLRAGINSFDIFDKNIATKIIFDKPIMIMEVKYDSFLPSHVRNILQIDSHNISAASKYVMCRELINHYK